jgi:hypothetical protein
LRRLRRWIGLAWLLPLLLTLAACGQAAPTPVATEAAAEAATAVATTAGSEPAGKPEITVHLSPT